MDNSRIDPRWTDLVARYETWLLHSSGRSPRTVTKYAGQLLALGRWYATPPDDPKLKPAGPSPVEATTDELELFAGLYAHHRGLSPRSRAPIIASLKSFYRWASRRAGLSDPASGLVYPEIGRRLPVPASLDTAEKLMMAPDVTTFLGLRDAAIIATLIGTGIRVSGLVSMNESALIWSTDKGQLLLDIKVTEKGGKERVVPVPTEAQVLVRSYLFHLDMDAIDRQLKDGDRVLWVSTRNRMCGAHEYHGERRRIRPGAINQLIKKYGKRAGVPMEHCHPHAFRHLFGTELAEHDIDPWQRQAMMGHADIKSTEVYTHLAMRKLRESSNKANPLKRLKSPILDSAREIHKRQRSS